MRGSIVTSVVLHAIVLALALVTLGSPQPLDVKDTEALPVDLVPISELTNIQQGEKTAPLKEKSSPKATKRQDKVDNAQNVGENDVDLKNPPTPAQRPQETEAAAAPKPVDKVQPKQDQTPNDVKEVQKEDTAPPPPDKAPQPTPKPPVPTPAPESKPEPKPEPKPETAKPEPKPAPTPPPKPQEVAKAEDAPTPDAVPTPQVKPVPDKPKQDPKKDDQAKADEKTDDAAKDVKPADKPKTPSQKSDQKDAKADSQSKSSDAKQGKEKKDTAKSASSMESDKLADEVSALLNKQDASGGGAKRSNQEASLGGKKTTGGGKLSQSEMDALKGAIQGNWNVIPGMMDAKDIRITVKFHLDKSGAIVGDPVASVTGGAGGSSVDVLKSSAVRAVLKSAPFTNLPADKYDTWSDIVVNFDPSDFM